MIDFCQGRRLILGPWEKSVNRWMKVSVSDRQCIFTTASVCGRAVPKLCLIKYTSLTHTVCSDSVYFVIKNQSKISMDDDDD